MKIHLNPDELTFGDMEDFESYADVPLMAVAGHLDEHGIAGLSGKAVTALVWICSRAEDPTFTVDDARKVKLVDLKDLEVEVGTEDPTPAVD